MERRKSNKFANALAVITALCSVVIIALMVQTLTNNINFFMGTVLSFFFLLIIAITNLVIRLISKRKAERKGILLSSIGAAIIFIFLILSIVSYYNYI